MRPRSRAREIVLQMLFQRDLNALVDRPSIEQFISGRIRDKQAAQFARELYDGIVADLASIDAAISAAAENWQVRRMAVIDRNIIRLGAYELTKELETPASVILNEAIELARRFGSKDSPSFVNGVLDRLFRVRRPTATQA